MEAKVIKYLEDKGVNIEYAKGICMLIEPQTNVIELMTEFSNLQNSELQKENKKLREALEEKQDEVSEALDELQRMELHILNLENE